MFYRIKQFCRAVFPFLPTQEKVWLKTILSPSALELFFRQSKVEQRHAVDVARTIRQGRLDLTTEELNTLLTAALLHDCGKSLIPLRLWQRVAIVLLSPFSLGPKNKIAGQFPLLAQAMELADQHAVWGGKLAFAAGLPPEICNLIIYHHCPNHKLGYLLHEADEQN